MTILEIQRALKARGHDPGPLDDAWGRKTIAALKAFQASGGLPVTGVVDELTRNRLNTTLGVLGAGRARGEILKGPVPPPWHAGALRHIGLREIPGARSNPIILGFAERFAAWVRRAYTNDDTPWCGLFVGHQLAVALPDEVLPANPLSALAYAKMGRPLDGEPALGAVLVFSRKGGGHVGFYAGEDATHHHVLGGNQSNAVNVARLPKSRLVAMRWPKTWPAPTSGRVVLDAAGAPVSTSQA